ncbi:MAG: hypothetical protein JTT12_06670 [Candidatus Brockarchaeota archaeon]|nr:hypothetical protein [Candidatus Brockarchaeota archaeon]
MPELELLVAMLGSLITIFASIGSLAYWLGRKFTQIDARLEALEKKIDERFEVAEKRTNERFEALEKKIDERFEVTEERTNERFNTIERKTGNIVEATRNQLEFFTEFLGFRKVIEQRDVTFVRGELSRLFSISNPLTKEESKRLKELLDKDKLTLQEADELREIARKLVREYGDKVGETWKLLMYASLMRGIALSELEEQEKQENK